MCLLLDSANPCCMPMPPTNRQNIGKALQHSGGQQEKWGRDWQKLKLEVSWSAHDFD